MPLVSLATPEAFARLEVADGFMPYMAEVDVDNCFYRLRNDHALVRFSAYLLFVPIKPTYIRCAGSSLMGRI